MRKSTKRILISGIILMLGAGALLYVWDDLINYMAKKFILGQISKKLDGEAKIDRIHAYLFPPQVEIEGLEVAMKSGPLKRFKIREIIIQPGIGPVFAGKFYVKKILIKDPSFDVNLEGRSPKRPQAAKKKFKIPKISDFVELKVDALEVQGASLSLELPGDDVVVRVGQGKATYQGDKSGEMWSWKGAGEFQRKSEKAALEEISIQAERNGENISIKSLKFRGLGVVGTLSGTLYPKLNVDMSFSSTLSETLGKLKALKAIRMERPPSGDARITARIAGNWDRFEGQGEVLLRDVRMAERKFDLIKTNVTFDDASIKSLKAGITAGNIQVDVDMGPLTKGTLASFSLLAKEVPFEELEKNFLDPGAKEPALTGPLDIEARGQVGLSPFQLYGDYKITSPKLALYFNNGLERFIPIIFEQVALQGEMGWSKERQFFLDEGQVAAQGLEAKYKFEFPKGGKATGMWIGHVSRLSDLFEKKIPITGQGQVSGGLLVDGDNLEATVSLNLERFKYASRESHVLQGDIVFAKKRTMLKNFSLASEKATLSLEGDFDSKNSRDLVKADFSQFDLGWIAEVASLRYPWLQGIEGEGSGRVYLNDFSQDMTGQVELTSKKASWKGRALSSIEAELEMSGGETIFRKASIKGEDGPDIRVQGRIGKTTYEQVEVAFTRLPLAILDVPWFIQKISSHADGTIKVSGFLDDPEVNSSLQFYREDPKRGRQWAGVGSTSGRMSGLVCSVNLDGGTLDAQAKLNLKDLTGFETSGRLSTFSLLPVVEAVPTTVSGAWKLSGDMGRIESWNGVLTMEGFDVKNTSDRFYLSQPVTARLTEGVIGATTLSFKGDTSELNLSFSLDASKHLSGSAVGQLPLSLLSLFKTGITRAEGYLRVELNFGGRAPDVRAAGSLSADGALIQFKDFPHDLESTRLRGTIDQTVLTIDELQARVGGGTLTASGEVNFDPSAKKISLQADLDRVALRFPPWLPVKASGALSLGGNYERPLLKGEVVIHEARYQDEWDWKSKVLTFGASQRTRVLRSTEEGLYLDVHFVTEGDNFVLKNDIAEGKLRADIRLLGSDRQLGLLGRVEVIQGNVEFLDNLFELTSGVVTFDRSDDIHPVFDITAKTTVQQTDIFLDIRTEQDDITAFLSSQPPKDETNIIALLTLGVDTDELVSARQNSNLSSTVLPSVLSVPVQSKLQKGLRETRVLDSLQFVPFFSDQTQSTGLRMLVGKELFPKVKLLYSTDLFNVGAENTVRLEQNFNDNVSLQGSVRDNRQNQNEELDFGVDFEFKFDF